MPYRVCGRAAMNLAYSTCLNVLIQLLVRAPFLRREIRRRRLAGLESLVDVGRDGGGHVAVDGEQARGRLQAHLVDDERTPVAALGDVPV